MKELSIEDKAKRYDEALEKAKNYHSTETACNVRIAMENLFPVLKESEDEKIRKHLITLFKNEYGANSSARFAGIKVKDILSWLETQGVHANFRNGIQIGDKVTRNEDGVLVNLSQLNRVAKKDEKQGEQKPADKVEPKFKVGDWIIDVQGISANQIIGYEDDSYYIKTSCSTFYLPMKLTEKNYRLWTIQDAKDGDVLACPNDAGDRDVVFIFKNINSDEGWVFCFCASDANGCFCTNNDYVGNSNSTNISPATKEQRDLLFQKMKEAGYEWDAGKKELKKIEQKSSWSEDDEQTYFKSVEALEDLGKFELADWLKEHKNQFLKPQNTWKPSDGQMKALAEALSLAKNCGEENAFDLRTLYEQLKNYSYDKRTKRNSSPNV